MAVERYDHILIYNDNSIIYCKSTLTNKFRFALMEAKVH